MGLFSLELNALGKAAIGLVGAKVVAEGIRALKSNGTSARDMTFEEKRSFAKLVQESPLFQKLVSEGWSPRQVVEEYRPEHMSQEEFLQVFYEDVEKEDDDFSDLFDGYE